MATRQPDLVLITWSRNPLVRGSARRIISVRIVEMLSLVDLA